MDNCKEPNREYVYISNFRANAALCTHSAKEKEKLHQKLARSVRRRFYTKPRISIGPFIVFEDTQKLRGLFRVKALTGSAASLLTNHV